MTRHVNSMLRHCLLIWKPKRNERPGGNSSASSSVVAHPVFLHRHRSRSCSNESVTCSLLAPDVEITMEANPGTVECGDPAGYRKAGINRLSIGAQSFSAASLALLGRIHSVDDIERSVTEAHTAGFDNINLDIMYGLPGQSGAAAIFDIEQAARLEPSHLSWYQLTLEPNTVFHSRPPEGLPDDEADFRDSISWRGAVG